MMFPRTSHGREISREIISRFASRMALHCRAIRQLTYSKILSLLALVGLWSSCFSDYLNDPRDNLFYDRILLLGVFFYRLRELFRTSPGHRRFNGLFWLLLPGIVTTLVAYFVIHSRSLAIYGTLLYSCGLCLAWLGWQQCRRILPGFLALAIMTYPPQVVYTSLSELARSVSYRMTEVLASLLLPQFVFHDYFIQLKNSEFVIKFEPACGGALFILSYLSLMILLKVINFSWMAIAKAALVALLLGFILNIARIIFVLALVGAGYAEVALHTRHDLIGHLFQLFGLFIMISLPENVRFHRAGLISGADCR